MNPLLCFFSSKHINLSFRDKDLFTDQEIKIDSGKITLITGESGSGKSTLLFELARLTDYAKALSNAAPDSEK